MAKNKIGLQFDGFEEMIAQFDKLGNVKPVVEEALIKSQEHVANNLKIDMAKHHRTGRTESTIADDKKVDWEGFVASIDVGFDISNGGLASIFLMYGTPRMQKDTKLYNDVYGNGTRKEIGKIQEEIFRSAIAERMK